MQEPLFFFGISTVKIKEGETKQIPVLKSGTGPGSVWICSSSGTGIGGATEADYVPMKQLINFSEHEDCKWVKVTALSDYITEPDEIFRLQLLATDEMGAVGNPSVMVVTIKDMPRPDKPG